MDQKKQFELIDVDLRELRESELNANMMPEREFETLKQRIKNDGLLTTTLVVARMPDGALRICSGHWRRKAALEVGITQAKAFVFDYIDEQDFIARQLAYNKLVGVDDPVILGTMLSKLEKDLAIAAGFAELEYEQLTAIQTTEELQETMEEIEALDLTFKQEQMPRKFYLMLFYPIEAENQETVVDRIIEDLKTRKFDKDHGDALEVMLIDKELERKVLDMFSEISAAIGVKNFSEVFTHLLKWFASEQMMREDMQNNSVAVRLGLMRMSIPGSDYLILRKRKEQAIKYVEKSIQKFISMVKEGKIPKTQKKTK